MSKLASTFFALSESLLLTGLSLWLLLSQTACQPTPQLPTSVQKQLVSNSAEAETETITSEATATIGPVAQPFPVNADPWIKTEQMPWNYCEVLYVGNNRIGFSKVTVELPEIRELNQIRIRRLDIIDRDASGKRIPLRQVMSDSYEKPNGELSSFQFKSTVDGASDLEVAGKFVFGVLEVSRIQASEPTRHDRIPWEPNYWGPLGIQEILLRSPMQPEQIRTANVMVPQLAQFVSVKLESRQSEVIPLAEGGSQELLMIDITIGNEQNGVLSTVFTDQAGVIHKTITRSGQEILKFKISEPTFQRLSDQLTFTRGVVNKVPSTNPELLDRQSIRFRLEGNKVDPYDFLMDYHRQHRDSINTIICELLVEREVFDNSDKPDSDLPDDSYMESSIMLPADKELIGELVSTLRIPGESTTAELAESLRAGLHQRWKKLEIGENISSTLIVARELQGSCIDCANLLVTILRNQKIPARIVGGLLLDAKADHAIFHAWAQAWIGHRWRDLDATIPGNVGPTHIAMSSDSGEGDNPYAFFGPIVESIGKIKLIEVIEE